jgi:glycosyltransferase involved in cell wall biosynthesis
MRGIDAYGKHEPYVAELKQIHPNTKFLSPVDMRDLVSSLDEYDIGIVPYLGVNFNNQNASPNKTFEYMMAGMAVLASDLPVLSKIVNGCKSGRTYKQDDPEDLAEVLREMIPHIEEMKLNARMCAENEYNWKRQGKKLIDVYNWLVK